MPFSHPSPVTHKVGPGKDFVDIPSNADESPAWSLLVGIMSGLLRFHRFRVARSGRISGRSEDALQIFRALKMPPGPSRGAGAALAPDGRSLCVVQQGEQTQALQLQLWPEEELPAQVPLPSLDPSIRGLCMPISADGHIWAVSASCSDRSFQFQLVMQRLVVQEEEDAAGPRWEQVGRIFTQNCEFDPSLPRWGGHFLQGYAVLPGHGADGGTLILLSLRNCLFFTFNCSAPDSGWTKVHTSQKHYLPILGRAVYSQESKAVCMLRRNVVYAYTIGDEEKRLKLDPPIPIERLSLFNRNLSPSNRNNGCGILTHLGGGVMCSVWFMAGLKCAEHHRHAILTTFQLGPSPTDVKVLHSTCRRVYNMLPSKHIHEFGFCFLQEYKDNKVLAQHPVLDDGPSCRHLLPPTPNVYVKPHIDKNVLFIICQAGSKSFIYKTNIMDDSPRLEIAPLKQHYIVHGDDHGQRHFFRHSSKLYAVSFLEDGMHVLNLDTRRQHHFDRLARRPVSSADPFVMVIQVGPATLALTETLQVYRMVHLVSPPGSTSWVRCCTDQSHVLDRKVKLCGYVAVGDDSFIVCDTVTCSCLQFDLLAKQWHVVMPWAPWREYLPRDLPRKWLLNGRCVFVDGFIYTCSGNGNELIAFELLIENHCLYLKYPIFLPFSWEKENWQSERMCLDYAGKDVNSGALFFWVVQGMPIRYTPLKNQLWITAVEVKTEKTPNKSMKPVEINNVVCATHVNDQERAIHQDEVISTKCFAVSF